MKFDEQTVTNFGRLAWAKKGIILDEPTNHLEARQAG
jgi:ATPase subunit of ABC transporter with duplicated ATPase domains